MYSHKVIVTLPKNPNQADFTDDYGNGMYIEGGINLDSGSWIGIVRVIDAPTYAKMLKDSRITVFPHPLSPRKIEQHHVDKIPHIKGIKAGDSMYDVAIKLRDTHFLPGFDPEAP